MEAVARGYSENGSYMSEYFSHFTPASIEYSISKINYETILPTNPIEKNTTKIEFNSNGSPDFTDFSELAVQLTFHLTLANGKPIPAAPPPTEADPTPYKGAGCINYPAASLFRDLDFKLSGIQINGQNSGYPFIGYLQTLLGYQSDAKNGKLQMSGWFTEDDTKSTDPHGFGGFAKR